MKDVTKNWQGKTRGGMTVLAVLDEPHGIEGFPLLAVLKGGNGTVFSVITNRGGRQLSSAADMDADLLPVVPEKTPLERIAPFLDHWWRRSQWNGISKIRSVNFDTMTVQLLNTYEISTFLKDFEHSADPINGPWEKVP